MKYYSNKLNKQGRKIKTIYTLCWFKWFVSVPYSAAILDIYDSVRKSHTFLDKKTSGKMYGILQLCKYSAWWE